MGLEKELVRPYWFLGDISPWALDPELAWQYEFDRMPEQKLQIKRYLKYKINQNDAVKI